MGAAHQRVLESEWHRLPQEEEFEESLRAVWRKLQREEYQELQREEDEESLRAEGRWESLAGADQSPMRGKE
jgi:hypothetical protein